MRWLAPPQSHGPLASTLISGGHLDFTGLPSSREWVCAKEVAASIEMAEGDEEKGASLRRLD